MKYVRLLCGPKVVGILDSPTLNHQLLAFPYNTGSLHVLFGPVQRTQLLGSFDTSWLPPCAREGRPALATVNNAKKILVQADGHFDQDQKPKSELGRKRSGVRIQEAFLTL